MSSRKFRCELCVQTFSVSDLRMRNDEHLCVKCYHDKNAVAGGRQRPSRSQKARCERCCNEFYRKYMILKNDEHLCEPCADKTGMCWFACAIIGSDAKMMKAIRTKFKAEGEADRLGKIVIPKQRVAARSKSRWRAVDAENNPIIIQDWRTGKQAFADITADDHESALADAIKLYDNTEVEITETKRVRKSIDKKRQTINQTKIVGMKRIEVSDVVQIKEGGEAKIRNTRAMPGYLLVQCENDVDLLLLIKEVKGVYSVLPFNETMSYEQYEKAAEKGDVPRPAVVSDRQVERVAMDPKTLPIVINYKPQEKVRIVSGMYASVGEAEVIAVLGTHENPLIRCRIQFMGRPLETNINHVDVRKL